MNDIRFILAAYLASAAVVGGYAWTLMRRLRRARR
jgi:hypothetical protein